MVEFRSWIEIAYFFSGVVLAGVAIVGLQQLNIMKKDMMIRIERAAKEKAIEYSTRYLTVYAELIGKYCLEYREKKLNPYNGSIGDFTKSSLSKEAIENVKKRAAILSWLPAMNELEAVSSAFMTGVADERTGFDIIGRTFCLSVALNYDILSHCRSGSVNDYYRNIVNLYEIWAPRLNKAELEAARSKMDETISCIRESCVPPIGKT